MLVDDNNNYIKLVKTITHHNKTNQRINESSSWYDKSSSSTTGIESTTCWQGGSFYPHESDGSPMLNANWVMTAIETIISPCLVISWRYFWVRIPQNLKQSFAVSCLFLTRCYMGSVSTLFEIHFGHFIFCGTSPMYPSSASTLSPSIKWRIKEFRKISMSFHFPQGNGPLDQTISPVRMAWKLRPMFWNHEISPVHRHQSVVSSVSFQTTIKQNLLWKEKGKIKWIFDY